MSTSRRHNTLSHAQKRELCLWVEQNPKESKKALISWVEHKFGIQIGQSTVSVILKTKERWLGTVSTREALARRDRVVKHPMLDQCLSEWLDTLQGDVNISGGLIIEKARSLFTLLYPHDEMPAFSAGWLTAFKRRHGIKEMQRFGESGSVNMDLVEAALPSLQHKIAQYAKQDVYNMDETGLFYRLQGDRSLANKQLEGRKGSKERITIGVCVNADGTDKIPLLVIGTSIRPRCFKNVNLASLGITYHANKNAWMTKNIFNLWLKRFDQRMFGRKVLPLLDNFSGHTKPGDEDFPLLHNTEILFLPPNTTSKIQPCDAGIIRNFKALNKRRLYKLILENVENGKSNASNISLLDALQMAVKAWNEIESRCIENCFNHTKLFREQEEGDVNVDTEVINDIQLTVATLYQDNPLNIEELLDFPGESYLQVSLTDEELVGAVMQLDTNKGDKTAESDDEAVSRPELSMTEAIQTCSSLQSFLLHQLGEYTEHISALGKLEDHLKKDKIRSAKQRQITDFFSRP